LFISIGNSGSASIARASSSVTSLLNEALDGIPHPRSQAIDGDLSSPSAQSESGLDLFPLFLRQVPPERWLQRGKQFRLSYLGVVRFHLGKRAAYDRGVTSRIAVWVPRFAIIRIG